MAAPRRGDVTNVGIADGRILPLNTWSAAIRRALKVNDVIYVRVREAAQKQAARAELRIRPTVQGAALVMENKTGRLLAMAGAFSYPESQLNRAVQSVRQPGSTLKPLTYLTALQKGLQPNTLVMDAAHHAAADRKFSAMRAEGLLVAEKLPMAAAPASSRCGADWRIRAISRPRNLMANGIEDTPEQGLDRICELAMEAQLYKQCSRFYPFVLGAQPLRLIDLAAFYAAIANEGARPVPHAIDSIDATGPRDIQGRCECRGLDRRQ